MTLTCVCSVHCVMMKSITWLPLFRLRCHQFYSPLLLHVQCKCHKRTKTCMLRSPIPQRWQSSLLASTRILIFMLWSSLEIFAFQGKKTSKGNVDSQMKFKGLYTVVGKEFSIFSHIIQVRASCTILGSNNM